MSSQSPTPDFETWSGWVGKFRAVPMQVHWESPGGKPANWKPFWTEGQPAVLLESGIPGSRDLREAGTGDHQTILALEIREILTGWEDWAETTQPGQRGHWEPRKLYRGPPTDIWADWLGEWTAPGKADGSPFDGGAMGLLSYDLNRNWERIPEMAQDDLDLPLYLFYLPRVVLRFDHRLRRVTATRWIHLPEGVLKRPLQQVWEEEQTALRMLRRVWEHAVSQPSEAPYDPEVPLSDFVSGETSFTKEEYVSAVARVQDYIARGHSYQVNLAIRQSEPCEVPGWKLYEAVRAVNPSPYMGYWRHPEFEIVSASPELLARRRGSLVSARPIAGTRPRGSSPEQDQTLDSELHGHPKENAEHLMLVDLIRNDLGRVCLDGSVRVPEYATREYYSHVIHLVSQVEGEWPEGCGWWALLVATFPGGTITGAPKVRTMQIIEELEPVRRSFYTGSMGWVGYAGDSEWNILIRTLLLHRGTAHLTAGAGIVADSVPEAEYQECMQKGKALWKALALARSWENRVD